MAITLELTPELETKVRQNSSKAGLTIDGFIVESIRAYLTKFDKRQPQKIQARQFSQAEADLLLKINQSLSQIQWMHYRDLIAKRRAETLTSTEQDELIRISNEIEEKNAERIRYVAELAQMRHQTLPVMMKELGLNIMPIAAQ